ncbi:MAG TPA: DsrE family protein [Myxococcota bacterium]|nr:DsrE family protein [Myxococcota bacterium]
MHRLSLRSLPALIPVLPLVLVGWIVIGNPATATADTETTKRDAAIVVHIGHATDDLHAASMGMSLARMLQKKGGRVTVFLDREGVRLADDDMPKDLGWGKGSDSVRTMLAELVKAGGRVGLCPHCAMAAGIEEDDLVEGALILSDDEVAELFLNAERVIDY